MLLSLEDLGLRRGGRWLVRGLRLGLHAGEGLRVTGPNGAGKTTLLRTLAGLSWPAAGRVCWDGTPLHRQREAYGARLAYLPHADGLAADLSAREHLRLSLAGRAGVSAAAREAALARVGLATAADCPARWLSAGQRRRAALARVMLAGATLWLLDEPLTALDGAGCALVAALLGEHLAGGGMAVVSTHQPLPGLDAALRHLALGT